MRQGESYSRAHLSTVSCPFAVPVLMQTSQRHSCFRAQQILSIELRKSLAPDRSGAFPRVTTSAWPAFDG
jgi:hypothetical protein